MISTSVRVSKLSFERYPVKSAYDVKRRIDIIQKFKSGTTHGNYSNQEATLRGRGGSCIYNFFCSGMYEESDRRRGRLEIGAHRSSYLERTKT